MRVFKDNAGRSWSISVNIASAKRVRDVLKFDLLDLAGGNIFDRLGDDPILAANVLWVLVMPDAAKLGVTDEQFGEALGGDAFDAATDALVEEVFDFFPQRKRKVLGNLKEKFTLFQTRQLELAEKQVATLDDQAIEKLIRKNTPEAAGSSSMS
jgi:hypothetical protein